MGITCKVLGNPGNDNALFVTVDTGHTVKKLLFDLGYRCLDTLRFSDIMNIDHLFFTHFHMDHIGDFDWYFRHNYNRSGRPNIIWGPEGTLNVMKHRFRGFSWSHTEGEEGIWIVNEVLPGTVQSKRFELSDAFEKQYDMGQTERADRILSCESFIVEAFNVIHSVPVLGFILREPEHVNYDTDQLSRMGLEQGNWMKKLKEGKTSQGYLEVNGKKYDPDYLKKELLTVNKGDSLAYVTDYKIDDDSIEELAEVIKDCDTIYSESQYRHSDYELASKNFHVTSLQAAKLARASKSKKLILLHVSRRYTKSERHEILEEARNIFPETYYPEGW